MTARLIIGDVRAAVATLQTGSVDLVLTSPPFLALRSYLPPEHPDKALEIGSESTPGEFIDTLLDVVEACERALAPHGSMCIELGDTYSGSGGAGGDYGEGGLREGQPMFRQGYLRNDRDSRVPQANPKSAGKPKNNRFNQPEAGPRTGIGRTTNPPEGWPLDKSLCLIPELFRIALVYGFNPLTGRTTPRWRARNVIRWCRPNPPVGALADKFRPATSEMVVICKDRNRYFDLDAVRTEHQRDSSTSLRHGKGDGDEVGRRYNHGEDEFVNGGNPAGAPPLDWWNIPTHGYPGAHYATFPEALCVKPIEAMCPRRVCVTCGKPSERITETEYVKTRDGGAPNLSNGHHGPAKVNRKESGIGDNSVLAVNTTLGWTACRHNTWRPGLVLDPFVGSGTTLAVAVGHGRDAIGIDLDSRNALLVERRLGMFLQVDGPTPVVDVSEAVL